MEFHISGCGKTTVIPRLLIADAESTKTTPRILVCQPRRLACTQIARRVREQLSPFPQYSVGHRIMNDVDDNSATIVFATTGY